jgi:hypothetical protein
VDSKFAGQIRDYVETAAAPIPLSSITRPPAAVGQSGRSGASRQSNSRRVITVAAATAVAAAAVIAAIAETGGPARTTDAAMLTAAMVHQVEAASQAAIAPAGHIFVTYSFGMTDHSPGSSGSVDYTFSGRNFNAVEHLPTAPRGHQTITIRWVNGQVYTVFPGRARQWYRIGRQPGAGREVPDPRQVLAALQPEARFEDIGTQRIDGVQTRVLKATRLSKLPASLLAAITFLSSMGPESLTGFYVWVDRHDVVRQVRINDSGQYQTIRFLDIGKPEKITAPGHYVNGFPRSRPSRPGHHAS